MKLGAILAKLTGDQTRKQNVIKVLGTRCLMSLGGLRTDKDPKFLKLFLRDIKQLRSLALTAEKEQNHRLANACKDTRAKMIYELQNVYLPRLKPELSEEKREQVRYIYESEVLPELLRDMHRELKLSFLTRAEEDILIFEAELLMHSLAEDTEIGWELYKDEREPIYLEQMVRMLKDQYRLLNLLQTKQLTEQAQTVHEHISRNLMSLRAEYESESSLPGFDRVYEERVKPLIRKLPESLF